MRKAFLIATCIAVSAVVLQLRQAGAKQIILNCEIEEGASEGHRSTQILIDKDEGKVIYHYQYVKEPGCLQKFRIEDSVPARYRTIDVCMTITINTDKLIQANDSSGAIVITKHDGRFVKAFVTPVPAAEGNFMAFGNTHWGKCVKNPFK